MKVAIILVCAMVGTSLADPDTDQTLYDAARAYEAAHSVAAAIQMYALLEKQFPNSKLVPLALAHEGKLYGDVAMYDRAAEKLEQYAKKYPAEKDAVDALSDAIYYRKALGDRAKAIEDTNYFIKTYGAKKPIESADAAWSLTALYDDDPDASVKALREYLHTYSTKDAPERIVIAYAKIGQLLWKQSCPIAMTDGLCVIANDAKWSCGPATAHTLTPHARDATKAKEAQDAFTDAMVTFEKKSVTDPSARYYYAQSKLAAADAELEAYLGLAFPRNLDFSPTNKAVREKSYKRFNTWMVDKTDKGSKVSRKYEAVLAIKDVASAITASERVALIAHSFAATLVTGEIPRDVVRIGKDAVDAYCDALVTASQPLDERAASGYGVCLAKSTELSWFDDSSRECERELARLKPEEFPLATELHAQSTDLAPVVVSEPPPKLVAQP